MVITRQDGVVDECTDIMVQGKVIYYTPKNDRRKKEMAGVYENRERATEIFSEMTCEGWNSKNPNYVMPIN